MATNLQVVEGGEFTITGNDDADADCYFDFLVINVNDVTPEAP